MASSVCAVDMVLDASDASLTDLGGSCAAEPARLSRSKGHGSFSGGWIIAPLSIATALEEEFSDKISQPPFEATDGDGENMNRRAFRMETPVVAAEEEDASEGWPNARDITSSSSCGLSVSPVLFPPPNKTKKKQ